MSGVIPLSGAQIRILLESYPYISPLLLLPFSVELIEPEFNFLFIRFKKFIQFIMKKYNYFFYVYDNKSTTCTYWNCKFKFVKNRNYIIKMILISKSIVTCFRLLHLEFQYARRVSTNKTIEYLML